MRKILLVLCSLALVGVVSFVEAPASVGMPVCTCANQRTACGQYCLSIDCRKSIFRCNVNDPCNSTCSCGECIP